MFKSSKKSGGSAKSGGEKKAKSKPEKLAQASSAGGGLKDLAIQHVEKVVLGLIVALMVFLIYDGTQTKTYPSERTPSDMEEKTTRARREIEQGDHWSHLAADRKVESNFPDEVEKARRPTDPSLYPSFVLENTPRTSTTKRGDPELVKPLAVMGYSMTAAIAMNSRIKKNPFESLMAAPAVDFRRTKSSASTGGGGSPYGSAGGPSGSASKVKEEKPFVPRAIDPKFDRGFVVTGPAAALVEAGGIAMNPSSSRDRDKAGKNTSFMISEPRTFTSVVALAPYGEQLEKYRETLEKSAGFNPQRDAPFYLGFEVQRVEVTNDPNRAIDESEWKDLPNASSKSIVKSFENWAGECPEVVIKDHVNPNLTMPIPPVLLRDYKLIAKHPETPLSEEAKAAAAPPPPPTQKAPPPSPTGKGKGGSPYGNYPTGGSPYGGGPPPGSSGGGNPYGAGYPSGGGPPGGGPPPGSNMSGGNPYGGNAPFGSAGSDRYGAGSPYVPGGGATPPGLGGPAQPQDRPAVTKYHLIRFYDFEVQPGKVYRYRVRLLVEDVNYPEDSRFEPSLSTLKADTLKRVYELKAIDQVNADKAKADPKLTFERSFTLRTDWSEAGAPIRVDYPIRAYIGETRTMSNRDADVVVVEWDGKRGGDVVRREAKAVKGQVFAGKIKMNPTGTKGAEVINPLNKQVFLDDDFEFRSSATLVDMIFGEQLALYDRKDDPLVGVGKICMFDSATGELFISDEFEAFEPFRMYSFVEDIEYAEKVAESQRQSESSKQPGPGSGRPGAGGGGGTGGA